jgi:hypothetical protein
MKVCHPWSACLPSCMLAMLLPDIHSFHDVMHKHAGRDAPELMTAEHVRSRTADSRGARDAETQRRTCFSYLELQSGRGRRRKVSIGANQRSSHGYVRELEEHDASCARH